MPLMWAEDLEETHPELPEGWSGSMKAIQNLGGPWRCDTCDKASLLSYRCSRCGGDLVGEKDGVGSSQQGGSV